MRFYKHLYVGTYAGKHRFSIIQKIRKHQMQPGVYLLTPAANEQNLLDIIPSVTWCQMEKTGHLNDEQMIIGIAEGYEEALLLAGRIVDEMYQKTGAFHLSSFLEDSHK